MATVVYPRNTVSREILKEQIVKSIIDVLFDNNQLNDINQLQRIVDPQTGQLRTGRTNNESIVIYEQDYQDVQDSNFADFIEPVLICHKIGGTGENDLSGNWIPAQYTPFDSSILIFQVGDTTPTGNGPSILFAYQEQNQTTNCTQIEVPVAQALYTLSQLVASGNTLTTINPDLAKQTLDTTVYELLPQQTIRQQQINKFFADYQKLKPPQIPNFNPNIEGLISETEALDYDEDSVSNDKVDGEITRLDKFSDEENENKTMEWLRNDLNDYLQDLDAASGDSQDERPVYDTQSSGYLKIRNLNQSIIVRSQEGEDIGLIGNDMNNPIWQQDGFTIAMWVKFLDRVGEGTLFNLGAPLREENPYGFMLETYVLHKDDIIRPFEAMSCTDEEIYDTFTCSDSYYNIYESLFYQQPIAHTWETYIASRVEASGHCQGDLTVQCGDNSDCGDTLGTCIAIATQSFDANHTFFKNNDSERFVRLVVRESDDTLRDSHMGMSKGRGGYIMSRHDTRDGIISKTNYPNRLLLHTRIPIDLNEWFYVVATYKPDTNEDYTFDDADGGGSGPYFEDSYGPNGSTKLKWYPDYWLNHVIPFGTTPTEYMLDSDNIDTYWYFQCSYEPTGGGECEDGENPPYWSELGAYTHYSGYGNKCKVEFISKSDLLRAKGFKPS
jgi:hypothetical protein